jgi:hypothetical protein
MRALGVVQDDTTALSNEHIATVKENSVVPGSSMERSSTKIPRTDVRVMKHDDAVHNPLLGSAQRRTFGNNEASASCVHSSVPASLQNEPGLLKVDGYLPPGTNLTVSTSHGATLTISTRRGVLVSNTSVGNNSFQYFGDSESILTST